MMKYLVHSLLLRYAIHQYSPYLGRQLRLNSAKIDTPATQSEVERGHVYFVATPIGNMKDISSRAIHILSHVDVICAEDTRHTINLLRGLSLPQKELLSHHEHNWKSSIPKVLSLVGEGKSVAVVSDAGTPGISDPGSELANELHNHNIPLHPIPGPSAVISALSVCGFPSTEFTFIGFLPTKRKERKIKLSEIYNNQNIIVLFEAPHRILKTMIELQQLDSNNEKVNIHMSPYSMSERMCVCCKELTKLHEEIKRGTISEIVDWLKAKEVNKVSDVFIKVFITINIILGWKYNKRRILYCTGTSW